MCVHASLPPIHILHFPRRMPVQRVHDSHYSVNHQAFVRTKSILILFLVCNTNECGAQQRRKLPRRKTKVRGMERDRDEGRARLGRESDKPSSAAGMYKDGEGGARKLEGRGESGGSAERTGRQRLSARSCNCRREWCHWLVATKHTRVCAGRSLQTRTGANSSQCA